MRVLFLDGKISDKQKGERALAEKCIHGLIVGTCYPCSKASQPTEVRRKQKRQPAETKSVTAFGSAAVSPKELNLSGWQILHSTRGKENSEFSQMGTATHVHIDGFPLLWVIERLLECAPKLREIRVIPSMFKHLRKESHLKVCEERGVKIVTGHWRPNLAWKEGENRSRFYASQRLFFQALQGEQKALWDELLAMGFDSAQMTARYFCLKDEEYLSQQAIGEQFGYNTYDATNVVSRRLNGIIAYLDPSFETSEEAQFVTRGLKRKVAILRKYFAVADRERQLAIQAGVAQVPSGIPISRYEVYKELVAADREGKIQALKLVRPKAAKVLIERHGLVSGQFLTLQEVGDMMGGISRERVRQYEDEGLAFLDIANVE